MLSTPPAYAILLPFLPVFVAALLLMMASFQDLALRTLPNWMSLALAGLGILLRLLDGTLVSGLACAAAVFFAGLICWRCRWLGGGDVKLLAACTLLVAPVQVTTLILLTTCGGGALALSYLSLARLQTLWPASGLPSRHAGKPGLWRRLWRLECRRSLRRAPLPYGCAIAGAALILVLGPIGPLGH